MNPSPQRDKQASPLRSQLSILPNHRFDIQKPPPALTLSGQKYRRLSRPQLSPYASSPTIMNDYKPFTYVSGGAINSTLPSMIANLPSSAAVYDLAGQLWGYCTLWNILFGILLITNLKCIPFIWHLRILNACSRTLKIQRPKNPPTYSQIFQPIITTTQVPLMEIDFNIHKTNSSYFADVDIARAHLICTLFSVGIEHCRGGTGAYTGADVPFFSCALGAVSCSFKRELKAYESYELWTRVLSWDEKWIYLITHFVRRGTVKPKDYTLYPEQNPNAPELSETEGERHAEQQASLDVLSCHPGVVATALSKCVFKSGRRTIPPAFMFKMSGILPPVSSHKPTESAENCDDSDSQHGSCKSSDSGIALNNDDEESEIDRVEKERARGMEVAQCLGGNTQHALELEFTGSEEPVLGRHLDGVGLGGIARCAAMLARQSIRNAMS
ncbi:BgTH12-02586 [Blumeria graminis f. sp. triticale]|uniref:BgTH12-02586 n=1 Tax=Blumeria graminis f. sp. triticale TaxID=1689686 RepID=A0A9W4GEU9_BLUGR|nr:BgTH12-02586 [Blumeria graminis f. sp. triticale]